MENVKFGIQNTHSKGRLIMADDKADPTLDDVLEELRDIKSTLDKHGRQLKGVAKLVILLIPIFILLTTIILSS